MITKNDIPSFTFQERFNKKKSIKLEKYWTEVINQLPLSRRNKILEKAKEFDPLNYIKKFNKLKTDINPVKYSFSKNSKSYGRLFGKNSLQGLPREFRSLLAKDYYYDVDFVSCHPNLLQQYCDKNAIRCDKLSYYNANRDSVFQDIYNLTGMERDDIKNLILTLLNGGDRDGLTATIPFLNDFKKEMTLIHEVIVKQNQKIYKQVKKTWGDNEPNINGKVVNRILCDLENDVMLTAVAFLTNKGYNIDCLIFDGFLIRIEDDKPISQDLFDITSVHIFEMTGYNLKIVVKPFDNIINLDVFEDDIPDVKIDLTNETTYFKDKVEFEKTHFKLMFPASYVTVLDNGELYFQTPENFHQSYSHKSTKLLKGEGDKATIVETPFTRYWITDENIRLYTKANFYPNKNKCPTDVYNLFKGFEAEKLPPINDINKINILIEPIIHQLKVIAQDNWEFIIIYLAFVIQYPEFKTNVNIIIAGKEGSGKNIIFDFFREKILGKDISAQTADSDCLFSRFSNIYVQKIFLQIDEVCKDDFTRKNIERLKNITTSATIKYEKKGFDEITINNYVNIVMTTNNDFVIPITQNDRRNVFFRCDETYVGNTEYFSNLGSHIYKDEVARAFYEYLLSYNLSNIFNVYQVEGGLQFIRPKTEFSEELRNICLSPIYRFYSALTCYTYNTDCINDEFNDEELYINIKASRLYSTYTEWFSRCNYNLKPYTLTKFFIDIKKIEGITNKRKNDGMIYIIEKNKLKEYLIETKSYDEDAFIC